MLLSPAVRPDSHLENHWSRTTPRITFCLPWIERKEDYSACGISVHTRKEVLTMDHHQHRQGRLPRRTFLRKLGALAAIGFGVGTSTATGAQSSGTPQASPAWTPPGIPKPLPTQGGTPPVPVGAAATPVTSPAATPAESSNPVEEPGAAAQPVTGTEGGTPEASVTVTITPDFTFDPDQLTIDTGDVVRWHNAGRSPQTVTADPGKAQDTSHASVPEGAEPFDSGAINAGEDFTYRFDVAGDYVYVSLPMESEGMVGYITVNGKG